MATMPTIGPRAKTGKAHCQLQASTSSGTNRIVTRVSMKPSAVCRVRDVPRVSSSVVSVTMVENCAESATMLAPQISKTGTTMSGDSPKSNGVASAQAPEIAKDPPATRVRPKRSDNLPAHHAAAPPTAITANVITGTDP